MLTGDSTDGIKGVPGIGKVKAAKILSTSKNYKLSVIEAYQKYFKENWKYEYDKSYFNLYLGCNREEPESLDGAISDAVKLTKQLENSINV
jgi:5'-3' exonuclease